MAADIETLTVTREGKLISVVASMVIHAPRPLVYQALSDYDRFSELSDSYVESRFVEPAADGRPRIYTEVEGCIWFFCRTIHRYATLDLEPVEKIVATVEPERSDADYAREEWLLEDLQSSTRVLYRHDLQPDFWVPPGIGVWAIKRVLANSSRKAAERIEKLAQELQADDSDAMSAVEAP
jgi:hypothetical protein